MTSSDFGELVIKITHTTSLLPLEGAIIELTSEKQSQRTGKDGICRFKIRTPRIILSLLPGAEMPYAICNYRIKAANYVPVVVFGEQVFTGSTTQNRINMTLMADDPLLRTDTVIIPPHSLAVGARSANRNMALPAISETIVRQVYVPENITVHLGAPDEPARNVTVPFIEYIQSVASSEIYPTWPEAALRANILAQITLALNRIYTEWYPSQGYDFDITSSSAYDQYYVFERGTFDSTNIIVNEIFNNYISRKGDTEPIFAQYCDGATVSCDGLSQWGTVSLARKNYTPLEIIRYYYGDDTEILTAPVQRVIPGSYPGRPLSRGDSGDDIAATQRRLNRIAIEYPALPFIVLPNGTFGADTESAVRSFQRIFGLDVTGIIDEATWYRIIYIYTAVKELAALTSEGEREETDTYPGEPLSTGARGIDVLRMQWYIDRIAATLNGEIPQVSTEGVFDSATEQAVRAFQAYYGLPITGVINEVTWDRIVAVYYAISEEAPIESTSNEPYPGSPVRRGDVGENVLYIQNTLNSIGESVADITALVPDGIFGPATEKAVTEFQSIYSLDVDGIVGINTWNKLSEVYNELNRNAKG